MSKTISRAACTLLLLLAAACSGGAPKQTAAPPPKKFPVPLFDGLWLGMTRAEAASAHPIRPALTSEGKRRHVWIYDRPGEYTAELAFKEDSALARLTRIDVHFGANRTASERTIADLART